MFSCYSCQVHFRAPNGVNGQGSSMHGADAEDMLISVPPGTIIRRKEAEEDEAPLAELVRWGNLSSFSFGFQSALVSGSSLVCHHHS